MSRRRSPNAVRPETLASFDSVADDPLGPEPPATAIAPPVVAEPRETVIYKARIELPLATFRPEVYLHSHVEVRLDPPQQVALRRLFDGLDLAGARLKNGRRVSSPPDCVRYLLEQLASDHASD